MAGLRIVAPMPTEDGYTHTRGTRVFVGSEELQVTRLDVEAEPGCLWRCTLETTAVSFGDAPHRDGPFSLQALTWTPHEMARFQDAVRGVHRRLADWHRSERGRWYAAQFAKQLARFRNVRTVTIGPSP